jgi:hypothetical protein
MYCDFFNTDLRDKIAAIKCHINLITIIFFYNSKPVIEAQYKNLKTAQLAYANKGFILLCMIQVV